MTTRTRVRIIATIILILAILGLLVGLLQYGWERNNSYFPSSRKVIMNDEMEGWSQAEVAQYYLDAATKMGEEVAQKFHLEPAEGEDTAAQMVGGGNCGGKSGFTKKFFISSMGARSQIYKAAPTKDWPAMKEFVAERMAELGYTIEIDTADEPGEYQSIDFFDKHDANAYFGQEINFLITINSPCTRMSHEGLGDIPDSVK